MLEFPAPEIGEVIRGRKSFKTAAKSVGKQTLKNNWVAVVNRAEPFQQYLLNNPVGREETFLQIFLVDHVKQQFSVPTFSGSVWKSWRESPNCWRCPVLARTRKLFKYLTWLKTSSSLILKRIGTITKIWDNLFLPLKLNFVKARGNDTYESKKKKKQQKNESVVFTETGTDHEQEGDVARVTYVNNIMHSIYSNFELYINNQPIYNSSPTDCMHTSLKQL